MKKRIAIFIVFAALLSRCSDPVEEFKGGRLLDPCNNSVPVCTTSAGCSLGDGNDRYLEGRFPGPRRFSVRTKGKADITVAIFLTSQAAVGSELKIEWNDSGCGIKEVESVLGKAFFKEAEQGTFRRTRTVYIPGDHLIEVTSDSTAEYILKVETSEQTEQ
jgi:hypothetical protein